MTTPQRTVGVLVCFAIATIAGCERSAPPAPPFNTVLGGSTYGAPPAMGATDTSLLRDITGYVPTPVPGISSVGGSAPAAANPGDAEGAVRGLVMGAVEAAIRGDLDKLLDAFQAEQVAALRGDTAAMSALRETYEKTITLLRIIGSKTGQPTLDPSEMSLDAMLKLANEQLRPMGMSIDPTQMLKIDVKDSDNATISIHPPSMPAVGMAPPEGLTPEQLAAFQAAQQAAAQQEADGGMSNAGPPMLVVRQGDRWYIQLPMAISTEQVKELRTAIRKFVKPVLDKLIEKIDALESIDEAGLQQLIQMTIMETISMQMVAEDEEEEEDDPTMPPTGDDGPDTDPPPPGGDTVPTDPPPPPPTDSPRNPRLPGGGG